MASLRRPLGLALAGGALLLAGCQSLAPSGALRPAAPAPAPPPPPPLAVSALFASAPKADGERMLLECMAPGAQGGACEMRFGGGAASSPPKQLRFDQPLTAGQSEALRQAARQRAAARGPVAEEFPQRPAELPLVAALAQDSGPCRADRERGDQHLLCLDAAGGARHVVLFWRGDCAGCAWAPVVLTLQPARR